MHYAIWLGLFMPLIGFLLLVVTSKVLSRQMTGFIACATILTSFLCFISLFFVYAQDDLEPITAKLFSWIPILNINADFSVRIDPLSLLMTLIITGVGFLIHVYANGYMEHDEDYVRFFAFLNFFVFAMLLLVLASNLVLLFVGWEGVGLASYLLIGYWYERPVAANAATKAFVMNRIGDLGFLLGLLLIFHLFGTSEISEISYMVGLKFATSAPVITVLTMLLFIGAIGKSAQLPLFTWLPDAMAGPTPVSALIHAATMVTAGVYLVVRMHPIFLLAPDTLHVIGITGGATALFAALCAVGQTDLKKVLAYSTVSQLGLMFLACGVGAFYAAMFHLTMHAFMKACLFLAAGNVVHMMHDTTEMSKMGGLANIFKKTNIFFIIGVLAMSGVPPLAAFFSKDLILEQEYQAGYKTLFYVGLFASILTAYYLTRAYCLTFTGKSQLNHKSLREAPALMWVPVGVLAVLSAVGGFLGFSLDSIPPLESFLAKAGVTLAIPSHKTGIQLSFETWVSVIGGLAGIGLAAMMFIRYKERFNHPWLLLKKSFYVDEIYDAIFVKPLVVLSLFVARFIEPKIFDQSIQMTTTATQDVASRLQLMQSGQIRSYVAWMVFGAVFLIVYCTY